MSKRKRARSVFVTLVDTVCISSYTLRTQGRPNVLKGITTEDGGRNWLIVDDLVDTGKTAQVVRALLPNACFATVYAKPEGRSFVDTPEPKGPGTAAVPPFAIGNKVSITLCPVIRGLFGGNFSLYGLPTRTGHFCINCKL